MFAHISMNWRGRPLESHETVVQLWFASDFVTQIG